MVQQQGRLPYPLHYGVGYLVDTIRREHATDDIFVAILVERTACSVLVHAGNDLHHLTQRHIVMHHLLGVEQYLILLDLATQHGYLRYTTCSEQARTDGPIGQGTQVAQRSTVCRQTHEEYLAQDR